MARGVAQGVRVRCVRLGVDRLHVVVGKDLRDVPRLPRPGLLQMTRGGEVLGSAPALMRSLQSASAAKCPPSGVSIGAMLPTMVRPAGPDWMPAARERRPARPRQESTGSTER